MSGIFISYRRASSSAVVYRLVDELKECFGEDALFFDAESIDPGTPFDQVIKTALSKCSIALIVIGPKWLEITDDAGKRRLDNSDDWVRLEIKEAISSRARVIPVLVEGATMPQPEELPDDIKELSKLQAFAFANSPNYWDFDVKRLEEKLRKIDKTLPNNKGENQDEKKPQGGFSKKVIWGYALGVLLLFGLPESESDADALYGLAFLLGLTGVLHWLGLQDINRGWVTGKRSAVAGMWVSGVLAVLVASMGAEVNNGTEQGVIDAATPSYEATEPAAQNFVPPAPATQRSALNTPSNTQAPATRPQQVDISQNQQSATARIQQINGLWRSDIGTSYQFQQSDEEFSFIELNAFGVQVGYANGDFEDGVYHFDYVNTLLSVSYQGQMVLDASGSVFSGNLTDYNSGQTLAFQIHR